MPIPIGTSSVAELKASVQVLTFDLYGTVVDMQGGLTDAVTPHLQAKGWSGRPASFVTWWRRTHFENSMIDALIDRGHTSYREIGRRALTLTLERSGIRHTQDEVQYLVSQIERLRPFTNGDPTGLTDNTLAGADFQYRNSNIFGDKLLQADVYYMKSFSSTASVSIARGRMVCRVTAADCRRSFRVLERAAPSHHTLRHLVTAAR